MKKLSIIIPCFNEEATIAEILDRVLSIGLSDWLLEVVVVDDHSTDGTPQILKKYNEKIKSIRLPENQGKGSAIK